MEPRNQSINPYRYVHELVHSWGIDLLVLGANQHGSTTQQLQSAPCLYPYAEGAIHQGHLTQDTHGRERSAEGKWLERGHNNGSKHEVAAYREK